MVWSTKVSWLVFYSLGCARLFAGETDISLKAESTLSDNGILNYLIDSLLITALISLAIASVVRFIIGKRV
jgi:hypothetical protein